MRRLLLGMVLVLAAGCAGGQMLATKNRHPLVGVWKVEKTGPLAVSWGDAEFRGDGTYVSNMNNILFGGSRFEGTWHEDEKVLVITPTTPGAGPATRSRWSVSKDRRQLTLWTDDAPAKAYPSVMVRER